VDSAGSGAAAGPSSGGIEEKATSGDGGGRAVPSSAEARREGGVERGEGRRSVSGMRRFAPSEERKAVGCEGV